MEPRISYPERFAGSSSDFIETGRYDSDAEPALPAQESRAKCDHWVVAPETVLSHPRATAPR